MKKLLLLLTITLFSPLTPATVTLTRFQVVQEAPVKPSKPRAVPRASSTAGLNKMVTQPGVSVIIKGFTYDQSTRTLTVTLDTILKNGFEQ